MNDQATHLSTSFGTGFLIIFSRVEPSSSGGQSMSTHPFSLTKLYTSFNSPDNKNDAKQRIIKQLNHVISSLSSDTNRNIFGSILAKTVTLNCLF